MSEVKNTNRLQGKDFINIGIFTAIYLVIAIVVAMLSFIPIFFPLLSVIVPLVCGIPFMLFLTRVKKPGMIFIMTLIITLVMFATGMGIYSLLVGIVTSVIAELIYRSGNYQSINKGVLAYAVFSCWIWGNYFMFFLTPDTYWANRTSMTAEYRSTLTGLMPMWMFPVLLVSCFVFGLLGGLIGKASLKKYFVKAGMA